MMPPWIDVLAVLMIWALICVGICLPMITWKLFWSNADEEFETRFRLSRLKERVEEYERR